MQIVLSLFLGLMLGSFSNVCIFRLPREESIGFTRSHCPHCLQTIRWFHNIPLISFILLRGKCAYCKAPISWQYPLVEAGMGALFVGSALRFAGEPQRIWICSLLCYYVLTISIIDYSHKIIPDELSLSMIIAGLGLSFWNPYLGGTRLPPFLESLAAVILGGGIMLLFAWLGEKIFKKEALGGGDVKLMAGFGALLGGCGVAGSLVIGSFCGALVGGALLILKRKKPGDAIPYGPFLCLGAFWVALFPSTRCFFLFP